MRTGNDQHGDDAIEHFDVEGVGDGPCDGGEDGRSQRDVEEPACGFIGEDLGFGFGLLCLFDEAHDASQCGFVAGGSDLHAQTSVAVNGARDDLLALVLVDGFGLACDHRFADIGEAANHFAIGRDTRAGTDEDQVAVLEVGD